MKVNNKILYLSFGLLFLLSAFVLAKTITIFDNWRLRESSKLLAESQKIEIEKDSFVLLQKAAMLNPSEETYLRAGIKAEELGFVEVANSYLKRVKTANGFYQLGNSYFNAKEYSKASSAYLKAINKEPKADFYLAKTKSELALVELDKAKADISKALGVQTGDEARFYSYLVAIISGENQKAPEFKKEEFALIKKRIETYKSDGNRANVIFETLNTLNYPQLAVWYLKDQELGGNLNRDGYLLLAKHYLSTKDYQNEYESLLKAKQKDEYYPQTYQQLVEVSRLLGKADDANKYSAFYSKLTW